MTGYSLWFVPGGETGEKLARIIRELGVKYNAPVFVPHMTLIPDVVGTSDEVLAKMREIAVGLTPFEIKLVDMGYVSGSLYQCLYAKAEVTAELQGAVDLARNAFGRESDAQFRPHLAEKEKLMPGLVEVVRGLAFSADHIEAWTNGLPIAGWEKVGSTSF